MPSERQAVGVPGATSPAVTIQFGPSSSSTVDSGRTAEGATAGERSAPSGKPTRLPTVSRNSSAAGMRVPHLRRRLSLREPTRLPDYLQRDQAPLGVDQWAAFDQTATRTAQSMLVARRFINLVGPFGPGIEALPNDTVSGATGGQIDLLGTEEGDAIGIDRRRFLPLPLLYKDFWVHWRDLESSRQLGVPLEVGKVAAAAAATAQAEDRLVFDGYPNLGLPGLRNAVDRQTLPMTQWGSIGRAFADVVEGMPALIQPGFTGPYAPAVCPRLYADLNRIFHDTGVLQLEQVEKLARRGVYPTAVLPEPSPLLVDSGARNPDLAIRADLPAPHPARNNLNHRFRVIESLVLRIRRAGAICTFEPAAPAARAASRG